MTAKLDSWTLYDAEEETLAFRFEVNRKEDFGSVSLRCLQTCFGLVGDDAVAAADAFLVNAKQIRKAAIVKAKAGLIPSLDIEDFRQGGSD